MPLPKPRKNEDKEEFISRCMGNDTMNREYPDEEQRAGVCYTQWTNRKKENDMKESINQSLNIEVKEANDKERIITAIGSKEVVDRSGDIVKVKGIDLKNYKKNPVVLLSHNYHDFPIGKAVGRKVWVDNDKLMFKIQFASAEENPKAEQAYKLYKGGYLSGLSLGFLPNWQEIEYPEKHPKGARRIFNKSELLEVSVVSVPDNQDALMAGINKAWDDGVFDGSDLSDWEEILKESAKEVVVEEDNSSESKEVKEEEAVPTEGLEKELDTAKELAASLDKELKDKMDKLNIKEIKIAELELQLKEQEIDEETDGFENYLAELFGEFNQADSSEQEADVEHTDEDLAREILEQIEQENE